MSRSWLIIEDNLKRVAALIDAINANVNSRNDAIYWIYAKKEIKTNLDTRYLDSITWRACNDETQFEQAIKDFDSGDMIALIDVYLEGVNNEELQRGFFPATLYQEFLNNNRSTRLVTFITSKTRIDNSVEALGAEMDDARIVSNEWRLSGTHLHKEAPKIVETVLKYWEHLADNVDVILEKFLDNMSEMNQEKLHEPWLQTDAPIQFRYLSELLEFHPDELCGHLKLKKGDSFVDTADVHECLKSMGDPESKKLSLMGATFIAWASYRRLFPRGKGNELFLNAIRGCKHLPLEERKTIRRNSSIFVLQKHPSLRGTISAFFGLMRASFQADRELPGYFEFGDDLLRDVVLSPTGLEIHVMIHPDYLRQALHELGGSIVNALTHAEVDIIGTRRYSHRVLDFWLRSAISDVAARLAADADPFWGSPFSLRIRAAGDKPKNGIILGFF